MPDLIIILTYLTFILGLGLYLSRKEGEKDDFFLASKQSSWIVIGASIFVVSISGEYFIGLFGLGEQYGLSIGNIELISCFLILVLSYIFVPLYLKANIYTVPQYLEKRFNKASRIYLSVISIFSYILTKIAIVLFAGGFLLNRILGWDISKSAIIIVIIAGIYAILGGFKTIIKLDVVQSLFLLAGLSLLLFYGLREIGGLTEIMKNSSSEYICILKWSDIGDLPILGLVFGIPIIGFAYWCTDQIIVQRVLSGRSVEDAQRGAILAGFLKILPLFLFVIPGMISFTILKHPHGDGHFAFASFIMNSFIPSGVRGLIITGLMAALISTLANTFNSSSLLFTMDLYKSNHTDASDEELVLVGRLATTALVIIGIIWIPFIRNFQTNPYIYVMKVNSLISPPIAAVFILGVLWKRMNAKGAIITLMTGGIIGIFRLLCELFYDCTAIQLPVLTTLLNMNFLYFAIILFGFSVIISITTSVLTTPDANPEVSKLVYKPSHNYFHTFRSSFDFMSRGLKRLNTKISILLVVLILILYIIF